MKLLTPVLALALQAAAGLALADNISVRLGYEEGRNGLSFAAQHAETGTFGLTPDTGNEAHGEKWRVVAKDAKGKILHQVNVRSGRDWVAESFDPGSGQIAHAQKVTQRSGLFEVSLPFDARVASVEVLPQVKGNQLASGALHKMDRKALQQLLSKSQSKKNLLAGVTATTVYESGPAATRMDYVFIGDGYTAAEMSKWQADAKKIIDGFLADPLFAANKNKINVRRVDVPSNQSGVDEIDKGIYKDTALDGEFGCYNMERLLCVNNTKTINTAASVLAPDQRDVLIVVSNSTRYGGSGGQVATLSMHSSSIEVALHEIGHTAFALADEYDYGTCDASSEPTEGNVSRVGTRSVKWGSQIAAGTAVPTQAGQYPNGTVGAFQGAQYCTAGKYRPTENSRMRALGQPWHAVNESLVAKVFAKYSGGTDPGGGTTTSKTQSGNLTAGAKAYAPSASPGYFQAGAGVINLKLSGPSGTDFDLALYKYTASGWSKVAGSDGPTSAESISYTAAAGYYYAEIHSYSGSGTYTLNYSYTNPK
ncbi:M64 family metallopeptidase [Massilia sp. W12]|uniref:M64 family metallopeptidase n=1 Tax=Massilia sp. W12 TaxID=3126507 RepID=UPI0030CF7954